MFLHIVISVVSASRYICHFCFILSCCYICCFFILSCQLYDLLFCFLLINVMPSSVDSPISPGGLGSPMDDYPPSYNSMSSPSADGNAIPVHPLRLERGAMTRRGFGGEGDLEDPMMQQNPGNRNSTWQGPVAYREWAILLHCLISFSFFVVFECCSIGLLTCTGMYWCMISP